MSDSVQSIRSLYKLLSSYRDRDVFRTLSNFKMERFAKRKMPECRCATRKFSGQGGMFVEQRHFDEDFVKNTRKRGPTGKNFRVFSPRYFYNYILNGKFKPKMDTIRAFLSKIRTFFSIFTKDRGTSSLPHSCAPVSVPEYASICLNKPKYPSKCLNKLF